MWVTLKTTSKIVASLSTRNICKKFPTKSKNGMTSVSATRNLIIGSPRMRTMSRLMRVHQSFKAQMKRKKKTFSPSRMRDKKAQKPLPCQDLKSFKCVGHQHADTKRPLIRKVRFACGCSRQQSSSLRTLISTLATRILLTAVLSLGVSVLRAKPRQQSLKKMVWKKRTLPLQIKETEALLISSRTGNSHRSYGERKAQESRNQSV